MKKYQPNVIRLDFGKYKSKWTEIVHPSYTSAYHATALVLQAKGHMRKSRSGHCDNRCAECSFFSHAARWRIIGRLKAQDRPAQVAAIVTGKEST